MSLFLYIVSSFSYTFKTFEERSFLNWMRETKNLYVAEEYHFRFGIWLTNYRFVRSKNNAASGNHFKVGMNSLSALTQNEYRSFLGYTQNKNDLKSGKSIISNSKMFYSKINQLNKKESRSYPDELDYRTKTPSVLNPVMNVGSCGGGDWAFSVTACIETNYAIQKKELHKLSEQCLIDCVDTCDGCNSCKPYTAFFFITNSDKYQCHINTDSDYPYTGSKGECKFNLDKSLALYSGVIWSNDRPEDDMIDYLNDYGIGTAIMDASSAFFQLYVSGIYDDKNCGTAANHAINVVGYGFDGEGDSSILYWICRNCWGNSWGEDGYFRIIRGNNECGISKQLGFPLSF